MGFNPEFLTSSRGRPFSDDSPGSTLRPGNSHFNERHHPAGAESQQPATLRHQASHHVDRGTRHATHLVSSGKTWTRASHHSRRAATKQRGQAVADLYETSGCRGRERAWLRGAVTRWGNLWGRARRGPPDAGPPPMTERTESRFNRRTGAAQHGPTRRGVRSHQKSRSSIPPVTSSSADSTLTSPLLLPSLARPCACSPPQPVLSVSIVMLLPPTP